MTIIDVRSVEEYKSGHVKNSKNIPLQVIKDHLNEMTSYSKPIILCCASGNRSGQATTFLKSKGVECENGGSWREVEDELKNNE
ncbi:MAG TPA: rhodanese-like domain-containing protein [Cytophagaceae bacterium]|jgi:phage shock protein E|nr:rhodanese-like domain-containing protein [Cytophagaceae bacterium]